MLLAALFSAMLLVNVVPIGNSSESLNANKIFSLRLDYILHSLIWLSFAWLWVLTRIWNLRFFVHHELLKYTMLIYSFAIICEYLQKLVPYRSFNPWDLLYNVIGASMSMIFILISRHFASKVTHK